MIGNVISPTSVAGILGIMVLCVTVLFMALAISSLLPRPAWVYKVRDWARSSTPRKELRR